MHRKRIGTFFVISVVKAVWFCDRVGVSDSILRLPRNYLIFTTYPIDCHITTTSQ